jgi:hypothetical protein
MMDALTTGMFDANLDGTGEEAHPDWRNKVDWLGIQYYFRSGVSAANPLLPEPVALTPCTNGFDFGACLQTTNQTFCVPQMGYEFWPEALEATIALGPEIEQLHAPAAFGAALQIAARFTARRHHGVKKIVRNRKAIEHRDHALRRARRVGDEHDRTARRAEPADRIDGRREHLAPVVEHPPHVADRAIVVGRDIGQAGKDWRRRNDHGLCLHSRP